MDNSTLLSFSLMPQLSEHTSETEDRLTTVLEFIETHVINAVAKQAQNPIGFAVIYGQLSESICHEIRKNNHALDELATVGDRIMGRMLPGKKSGMVQSVMSHSKFRISTATFLIGVVVCCFVKYLREQIEAKNMDNAALRDYLTEMYQFEHA